MFIFDINLRNPRELRGVLSVQNQALAQTQRALPQPQENGRISFDPSVFERMDLERRLRHAVMRGPLDDYIPQKRPQELERLLQSVQEFRPSIPSNVLQSLIEPPPEMNMDDFVLVRGPTLRLPGIGVLSERLYGQNGILMRVMLFRALLNEYADLLTSMGVELSDTKGSKELERAFYFLNCPSSAPSAIEQYEQFVDAHEALILAEKSPEVSEISKKMALARMTPRIQAFQEAFVQEHVGDHDPFTLENFTETFVTRNKTIAASDPQMRVDYWTREGIKLYGAMSWAHYLKINPPQLRNQEDGVFYLRHATPNKYDPERGVIIDPLYREFLRGADGMVLYAAHQRLKDDGFPENEDVRCQTLVQCESEEENLLLIFQSVENSLFKKGAKTFAELKEKLIDSFYLEEGSRLNRLPARLQGDAGYRERMREIFDFIHHNFFDGRENIRQEKVDLYGGLPEDKKTTEWQVFIMLFYYYQREDLKTLFDVKYVNTGCKDDFDRGGGQNMVSDLMHLFEIYGKDIPRDKLRAIADSVQAPTLQLKGTEPIKYRVHPALCVANLLFSLSDPYRIGAITALNVQSLKLLISNCLCRTTSCSRTGVYINKLFRNLTNNVR
ncbi:MAG: hypothetical protein HRU43_07355, partial [Simkaniaceae bacterium]|nr:hypothetical protein [Simkaniaceae bacterium]